MANKSPFDQITNFLGGVGNSVKNAVSDFGNQVSGFTQHPVQYFNPQSDTNVQAPGVQNFWATPIAKGLAQTQTAIQQPIKRTFTVPLNVLNQNITYAQQNPQFARALPEMVNQGLQKATTDVYGNNLLSKTVGTTVGGIEKAFSSALLVPYKQQDVFGNVGDIAGGVGAVARPGMTVGFGAFNPVMTTAIDIWNGKLPTGTELKQSYEDGLDMGSKFAGIDIGLSPFFKPLIEKLAPVEITNINQYLNLAKAAAPEARSEILKLLAKRLIQNVGAEGLKGGTEFAAYNGFAPAKNVQQRMENMLEGFLQGFFFSGGIKAAGYGSQAFNEQIVKPGLLKLKQNGNLKGGIDFNARIGGGNVTPTDPEFIKVFDKVSKEGLKSLTPEELTVFGSHGMDAGRDAMAQTPPGFGMWHDNTLRHPSSGHTPQEIAQEVARYIDSGAVSDPHFNYSLRPRLGTAPIREYALPDTSIKIPTFKGGGERSAAADMTMHPYGQGEYLSTDPSIAKIFGDVNPTEVKIQNPLIIWNQNDLDHFMQEAIKGDKTNAAIPDLAKWAQTQGFDGIVDKMTDTVVKLKPEDVVEPAEAQAPGFLQGIKDILPKNMNDFQQGFVNFNAKVGGKTKTKVKPAAELPLAEEIPVKTGSATWTNNNVAKKVTVTGYLGEVDGRQFVKIKGSKTGIPLDELSFGKNHKIKMVQPRPVGDIATAPEEAIKANGLVTPNQANELRDLGYLDNQITQITPQEADRLIKEQVAPFMHETWPQPDISAEAQPRSVTERAGAETALNAEFKGGNLFNRVKALPHQVQGMFTDWVNKRRSTDIEGQIAKQPFTALDKQGLDAIKKFQSGDKTGVYSALEQYFTNKYKLLKSKGIDLNFKDNYLPQLWLEPQNEVQQKLGKQLNLKPGFTMNSVFKSYEEGIKKGLTPRFTKISDLVGWYEATANKALADREFFNNAIKSGFIAPKSNAPREWVELKSDRFPTFSTRLPGAGKYIGVFKAPKEFADVINNYLETPEGLWANIAKFTTKTKNISLSSGVAIPYPGITDGKLAMKVHRTGINAHGFNLWYRNIVASKNPISGFLKGTWWLVNPDAAEKQVAASLNRADFFSKHGLTLTTEEHAFTPVEREISGNIAQKTLGKVLTVQENLFEKPLFNKIAPAMKINYAEQLYQDFVKRMPEDQAAKQASKITNDVFGGINLDELGRSKELQNTLRSIFLAPDWAETQFRVGAGIVKGLAHPLNPLYAPYRRIAGNVALGYLTANIANKLLSGHWMFENPTGQEFNIDSNTYNDQGQKRYIRAFGTATDFVRLPSQILFGLAKGDPSAVFSSVRNRLSTPLAAAGALGFNRDYLNRSIYGKDKYGNPFTPSQNALNITAVVANAFGPQGLSNSFNVLSGKEGGEEGVINTLELPIKYSGGAYTPKQQQEVADMQSEGKSGADIFSFFQKQRDQTAADTKARESLGGSTKSKISGGSVYYVDKNGKKNKLDLTPAPKGEDLPALEGQNDALTTARTIIRNSQLFNKNGAFTTNEAKQYIQKLGVDYNKAYYGVIDQLPNAQKAPFVVDYLKKQPSANVATEINNLIDNKVLTTDLVTEMQKQAKITAQQAVGFKNLIKQRNAEIFGTGTTGSTRSGIKISASAFKAPAPKRTRSKIKPLSVKTPKIKLAKLPALPKLATTKYTPRRIVASIPRGSKVGLKLRRTA